MASAASNPWARLKSEQPDPNDLEAILADAQASQDPSASTPETDAMAAEQNPMPGAGQQPQSGSIFNLRGNQLPPGSTYADQLPAILQKMKANEGSLEEHRAGLKDYADQIKKHLAGPTGVDLSPLMAWADAWSGGHQAASYKAPMSQREKEELGLKLQDELLKRKQDLTKEEREALLAQANVAKMSKDTTIANQMRMQAADASYLEKAQTHLNSDKNVVKANGMIDEVNAVGQQLDSALSNPVAAAAIPIALARMMTGGQRLNEVEINKLGGSQKVADRLNQIWTTMQSGALSPANHKYMMDLASTLKKSSEENLLEAERRHAKQYAKLSNMDPDEAYLRITGKTPAELEAIQAREWVKKNPKADPKQIANIRAHYGF